MTSFEIDRLPDLHDPVAIIAFSGWNDAGSAATNAARFIVRRLGARRFAQLPAETFYSFTDTRPTVRASPGGERVVQWPTNEFFYARNPGGPHDIVAGIGVEPNLRWPSFAAAYAELIARTGATMTISLGALLADVPHTRPIRVTGTAADPEMAERLNLTRSKYEGPTGIVGVMHQAFMQAKISSASFWANVPHYITASQNPPATAALLQRVGEIAGLSFDLSELDDAGRRFEREVSTALGNNPEVQQYVERLQQAFDSGMTDEDVAEGPGPLEPGQVLADIEDFLRQQRDDD